MHFKSSHIILIYKIPIRKLFPVSYLCLFAQVRNNITWLEIPYYRRNDTYYNKRIIFANIIDNIQWKSSVSREQITENNVTGH